MKTVRPLSMLALVALMGCASQTPVIVSDPVPQSNLFSRVATNTVPGLKQVARHFVEVEIAIRLGRLISHKEIDPAKAERYFERVVREADADSDGVVSYVEGRAYTEMVLSVGHGLNRELPLDACYNPYKQEILKARRLFEAAPKDCEWATDELSDGAYKGCVEMHNTQATRVLRKASRDLRSCVKRK